MPLDDWVEQDIKNTIVRYDVIPRLQFETTTTAKVFGSFYVSIPVVIAYLIEQRNGIQDVRNATVWVGEYGEYPWADVPLYLQERWRKQMIENWNRARHLVIRRPD